MVMCNIRSLSEDQRFLRVSACILRMVSASRAVPSGEIFRLDSAAASGSNNCRTRMISMGE